MVADEKSLRNPVLMQMSHQICIAKESRKFKNWNTLEKEKKSYRITGTPRYSRFDY